MTSIEWSDEVWNFLLGCSRVSPGCDNCYAMFVSHRGMTIEHRGLTKLRVIGDRSGVDWTGEVKLLHERLGKPLRWKKPRRVFVNSMSDLFHPKVPFEFIATAFGVMAACPQHTFQILTKRPKRMLEFFEWMQGQTEGKCRPSLVAWDRAMKVGLVDGGPRDDVGWPAQNIHLGVSVEDQKTADERIPLLLQCPAAVRWVSYEPAIEGVDFAKYIHGICHTHAGLVFGRIKLDWIVVGGESGSRRKRMRQFDPSWAFDVIKQTRKTSCKVFVKQLGSLPFGPWGSWKKSGKKKFRELVWNNNTYRVFDHKGGNPLEWPSRLRVREAPVANSLAWDRAMRRAA